MAGRIPPETEQDRDAWADRAAELVAKHMRDSWISRNEVQGIADAAASKAAKEAVAEFAGRLGIGTPEAIEQFIVDRRWIRSRREIGEQVLRQGIVAVLVILLGAVGTALMFWIRSGLPK